MLPRIILFAPEIPESRNVFNLDLQAFLDMIPPLVSFIVLVLLLTYLLYKPVKSVLAARAERVFGELTGAEEENQKAHELRVMYEQKLHQYESDAAALLSEVRRQAHVVRDEIIDKAKAEAQEIRERASKDAAAELERVKGDVHHAIIDISADLAEKLIAANIDKSAHDRLFAEAMSDLEGAVLQPLNTYV